MFILNVNTAEFGPIYQVKFCTVVFFFFIQTLDFWVQPSALACLVGHRTLCWLVPSESRDSSNLSFRTLKALACSALVNHSASSSGEGNCTQLQFSLFKNPPEAWMFTWKRAEGSVRYWSQCFLILLSSPQLRVTNTELLETISAIQRWVLVCRGTQCDSGGAATSGKSVFK